MAHGLQVYNTSGQLVHDISDRLTRLIGTVLISGSGSFVVNDFALGTGWYFTQPFDNFSSSLRCYPSVSISDTTISWVTNASAEFQRSVWLFYGVY